jgi:hypothetical protein
MISMDAKCKKSNKFHCARTKACSSVQKAAFVLRQATYFEFGLFLRELELGSHPQGGNGHSPSQLADRIHERDMPSIS